MHKTFSAICLAALLGGAGASAQTAAPSSAAPLTAAAVSTPRSYAISDGRTPGGIRLVHMLLKDEKEQIFLMHWTDRHIQHTPEKAGLMALAPTLVSTGGTVALDAGALEEELKDLGGYFGLSRGRSTTQGQIAAPIDKFEATATLMRDALMQPRLPKITLERRKRFLLNNARAGLENAESLARQALSSIVVGEHPIARTIDYQPATTITDVSIADIETWRKTVLARRNLTVVSAGPLTREAAADLADRTFGGLPENDERREAIPFTPVPARERTIVIESPVAQSVILAGGPVTWRAGGADGVSRSIAMTVLGGGNRSRLFVSVREKLGAAYGASSGISALLGQQGVFAMQAAVANDKVPTALAAMRSEYKLFRETGVSAAEIDPIKVRMLNSAPESMRKARSAAGTIQGGLLNDQPFDAVDRYPTVVRAQKVEDINRLISEKLPAALTTIIVAPSADGLGADCVIKSIDQLKSCLAP